MTTPFDPANISDSQLDALIAEDIARIPPLTEQERRQLLAANLPSQHSTRKPAAQHLPAETLPPRDAPEPPRAYGYGRVSTAGQYGRDNSIPEQLSRIENYYKWALEPQGVTSFKFVEDGKAISARSVPFLSRPGGRILARELRQGDHLIIDKLDRMWRNLQDFCYILEWFKRNRITLHIINLNGLTLQTNSPSADFVLQMLVGFAQMEAETTRLRIKESAAAKRRDGLMQTSVPPYGTKLITPTGRTGRSRVKQLAWDHDERRIMGLIVKLREEHFMTFAEIGGELERRRRVRNGEPALSPQQLKTYGNRIFRLIHSQYCTEIAYRLLNITDATDVPVREVLDAVSSNYIREMRSHVASQRSAINRQKSAERWDAIRKHREHLQAG